MRCFGKQVFLTENLDNIPLLSWETNVFLSVFFPILQEFFFKCLISLSNILCNWTCGKKKREVFRVIRSSFLYYYCSYYLFVVPRKFLGLELVPNSCFKAFYFLEIQGNKLNAHVCVSDFSILTIKV